MLQKGVGVFIKVGTLVIKWDTFQDIVIKIGTRAIKVGTFVIKRDTFQDKVIKRALRGPSSASEEWNPGAVAILVLCYSTAVVTH